MDAISNLGVDKPLSIAFPEEIGSGLAGGDWAKDHGMIKKFAEANPDMEVTIVSWGKNIQRIEDPGEHGDQFHEKCLDTFIKDSQQEDSPGAVTDEAIEELASLMEERQRSR